MTQNTVLLALIATLFCYFMTALGSACVFLFKKISPSILSIMLGFSSGIMIAASFWSLLSPALELAENGNPPAYITVAAGFIFGALFTLASDAALKAVQRERDIQPTRRRLTLLVGAITVHNIPEGLAVGVAFGALSGNSGAAAFAAAASVAVGIGLQNFPEGAAVSLPMRREGHGRFRSFLAGQASALVEPLGGFLGALAVVRMQALLPFALSFAAGAMILVTVHELIPTCSASQQEHPYRATMSVLLGFTIMMLLDVALG